MKEIVLKAFNIEDFGKVESGDKVDEHTFLDLIEPLDDFKSIEIISSIEPNLLKNVIIESISKSERFVSPFIFLFKVRSDLEFKIMKRRYLTLLYTDCVFKIKKSIPRTYIGVHVIIGFPGESEVNFIQNFF